MTHQTPSHPTVEAIEGHAAAVEPEDPAALRRRAEASEARLRLLADAMPQQVWTATPDGMLDYVNDQVTRYSGCRVDELLGQGWARMVHPDDFAVAAASWGQALATGEPYEVEFRLARHDGVYRWHVGRALPAKDAAGAVTQWFGTNTDIHDYKLTLEELGEANATLAAQGEELQAQHEELQAHHEELETLTIELAGQKARVDDLVVQRTTERDRFFTLALDMMITCWPDGRLERANPSFLESLGYEFEALVGRSIMDLVHPDDRDSTLAELGRLASGAKTFRFENRYRRLDGAYRLLDWTAVFEDGMVYAFARDITERREAEERIARQMRELHAADRLKDQFLGILSHELRTPLNAIQGFGSVLEDGVVGELSPDQATYVGKILTSSDEMLRLVEDLLDMSRVQAGKFSLEPAPTRPTPLLRGVISQCRLQAEQRGHHLVDEVADALPTAMLDAQRVAQIATNLIGNAIKFVPPGGTITVRAWAEGGGLRVEVADTGIGIALEEQARIFQPFTQVDMSMTRAGGGAGLGLSIVQALVEAHGGAVGVVSAPGEGATFWFTLPLSPADGVRRGG